MSTPQEPLFVDSQILKALLEDKSKVPGKDYLVIDVRDDDRIGGHIPGSVNIPSREFLDRLPLAVEQYKAIPELYFHCALSQIRGPKAARRYAKALAELSESTAAEAAVDRDVPSQKINILRGGFGAWQRQHKDDKNLVEHYDADYWMEDYE